MIPPLNGYHPPPISRVIKNSPIHRTANKYPNYFQRVTSLLIINKLNLLIFNMEFRCQHLSFVFSPHFLWNHLGLVISEKQKKNK